MDPVYQKVKSCPSRLKNERDLYVPVRQFWQAQGYDVKAEVNYVDVLAVRDNHMVAIELKLNINFDLLLQASNRQQYMDYVYVAVPKRGRTLYTARWQKICALLKRLGIGLLLVGEDMLGELAVQLMFEAKAVDSVQRFNPRRRTKIFEEFTGREGDANVGGSVGVPIMTVYRQKSFLVAKALSQGPQTLRQLRARNLLACETVLQKNAYGWFVRVGRGSYALSEKGREALGTWNEDPSPENH